eukprot:12787460-Heterocapsa_arctica.AAC.1
MRWPSSDEREGELRDERIVQRDALGSALALASLRAAQVDDVAPLLGVDEDVAASKAAHFT